VYESPNAKLYAQQRRSEDHQLDGRYRLTRRRAPYTTLVLAQVQPSPDAGPSCSEDDDDDELRGTGTTGLARVKLKRRGAMRGKKRMAEMKVGDGMEFRSYRKIRWAERRRRGHVTVEKSQG
jgi:hypothetical protein